MATVVEIERETGVAASLIRKFVAEKRLHPAQFPNLTYSCEKCGGAIRDGRLCNLCKEEIESGLLQSERNEALEKRKAKLNNNRTYYSLKDE